MTRDILIRFVAAAAALSSANAGAQEQATPAATEAAVPLPFGAVAAIDNTELSAVTGRDDLTQVVNARNTGVVTGNTVSGQSQTGTIRFDSSSFQNLNGLSLLSANTGNNVSINSSLNVNVAISGR